MSAYSSIQDVAKTLVSPIVSGLVNERFPSKNYIEKVRCPVLFIHGKSDNLISY
jgi:fermentation-respiration switch protein FrsA (DUF1100 family)